MAGVIAQGCVRPAPVVSPRQAMVALQRWDVVADDMDSASLEAACNKAIAWLEARPGKRLRFGPRVVGAGELANALRWLRGVLVETPDPLERTREIARRFVPMAAAGVGEVGRVLVTGYYEPVIEARKSAQGEFVFPVYAVPRDLVFVDLGSFGGKGRAVGRLVGRRVVRYPSRCEIDFARAIEGSADVLGYVRSLVDLFFLHIQGSGVLVFADGTRLRVGYAATNGHPYRSIGRLMLAQGWMSREEMSMQGIRAFLAAHPALMKKILCHNPSYVFFRPLPSAGGPVGCYGVELTPGRSIATDRRLFPAMAPALLVGTIPSPGGGSRPFSRLVLNQDTGGAIKGPGRVDLFFGTGRAAGELAGRMKHWARLVFLVPRGSQEERVWLRR